MGLDVCSCSFHFKRVRVCTCVDVKLCTHVEIIFNKVLYDMLKRQMRVPISQQWCYSLRCFFSRFLDVHKIFTCTMAYQHKKLANCKWIQMKYIFCTSHRRLTIRNFTFFRFFFLFQFEIWNFGLSVVACCWVGRLCIIKRRTKCVQTRMYCKLRICHNNTKAVMISTYLRTYTDGKIPILFYLFSCELASLNVYALHTVYVHVPVFNTNCILIAANESHCVNILKSIHVFSYQ